jgi:alpha-glucosidase
MTASSLSSDSHVLSSPDERRSVTITLSDDGRPHYRVAADGEPIIAPSPLGFAFADAPAMREGFEVRDHSTRSVDTTWTPVWGPDDTVRNHFNELTVQLEEARAPGRRLTLVVRAYDDGIAFRYRWPEQPALDRLRITSEDTHFRFVGDPTCWWIPDDYDGYEWVYEQTPLSAIVDEAAAIGFDSYLDEKDTDVPQRPTSKEDHPGAVNTPITMRTAGGARYLSVHEAALTDYAGMTLQADPSEPTTLRSELVPWPDGTKVKADLPHQTPWRTLQIADTPGDLIESHLIENLNEPSQIDDPSWIEPMTYVGIWWGMHIDRYSWGRDGTHGATTERAKQYIDFAAEHDIGGVLVEGWNVGWESWRGNDEFDFLTPYPDFDLDDVAAYAQDNDVALIGHHETGGDVPAYEDQMNEAFALYEDLGVPAVKTGYAGMIRPEGVHHHGQKMVNHYQRVVELAAEHEIMLDVHEPIKPTGLRRTWPNLMTQEGVRGMEYDAWSKGNPPEHTLILPFTRMLAGPLDYTPGIVNLTPDDIQPHHRVRTTLAKQLANTVLLYSPVQMAADLVEHYEGHDALDFLAHLPTDWSASRVLNARIGAFLTMARRTRDDETWHVATATDEYARTLTVPLDFLDADRPYVAHVFEDAPEADYVEHPHALQIRRGLVTSDDVLTAQMGRSGGQAVRLVPATASDREHHTPLPL